MAFPEPTLVTCTHCKRALPAGAASCPHCGSSLGRADHTESYTPVTGRVLQGKWRLDQKLGQGGMGAVYLAHEDELDRRVAIKVLSDSLCDDGELVKRFEREARMMARLDHPNLVPIYAVGREGRVPFIVMKSLAGATLAQHLKDRGRLPIRELISIGRQLCAGLQFVHDHGVVHRDLKPGNVFIAPDGHVTLLDLGVAREQGSAMTRSGVLIGTPRYMAPEQISGQDVDHRSDLYALATVLYEMVTGNTVFPSDSDYSVMRAHVTEPAPDLSGVEGVPPSLAALLKKGLAKNPAERFQSARALADALEVVAQSPELAHLPDVPARSAPLPIPPLATPRPGNTQLDEVLAPTAISVSKRTGRKIALFVLGAAACGAAVGMGMAWKWGSTPAAQPPIVVPPPKPHDPLPETSAPSEAPGPREPPVPAERTAAPEQPVAKNAEKAPAKPKPEPTKTGPSEIRCMTTSAGEATWAYVDVDGLRKGTTPLTFKLSAGEHELVFRREGFATESRKVTLSAGETRRITVELRP